MKKFRGLMACIALLLMLLSLSGCKGTLLYGELFVRKRDTNGAENSSLAIYTEADVCDPELEGHGFIYGFLPSGEPSFSDEEYLWDADCTDASAHTAYSGNATLQLTYGKTDTIRFTVSPKRTEGNLRIVLLDQDFKLLYDFSIDRPSSYEVTDALGKQFEIRAVGEAAKFQIITEREFK